MCEISILIYFTTRVSRSPICVLSHLSHKKNQMHYSKCCRFINPFADNLPLSACDCCSFRRLLHGYTPRRLWEYDGHRKEEISVASAFSDTVPFERYYRLGEEMKKREDLGEREVRVGGRQKWWTGFFRPLDIRQRADI